MNQTTSDGHAMPASPLQTLMDEHQHCFALIEQLVQLVTDGNETRLGEAMRLAYAYYANELETHFQHEEHTIIAPLLQGYPEHMPLCVRLAQEHGVLRGLANRLKPGNGLASAKDDVLAFADGLHQHSVTEDTELFPLLAGLLTPVQWEAMRDFTPLYRVDAG